MCCEFAWFSGIPSATIQPLPICSAGVGVCEVVDLFISNIYEIVEADGNCVYKK